MSTVNVNEEQSVTTLLKDAAIILGTVCASAIVILSCAGATTLVLTGVS